MKKVLLISLLVVAFTLFLSATALANNGPHLGGTTASAANGGFAQDTDACAGCHRAHTGTQAKLLMNGATMDDFCKTCHTGTGANTNVDTGQFEGDADITYETHNSKTDGEAGKGLNGGGFVNAYTYTGLSGRSTSVAIGATGSTHSTNASSQTAWGGGTTGSGTPLGGTAIALDCASCHDPHGSKNNDAVADNPLTTLVDESVPATERYRILKNTVNLVSVGPIKSHEAQFAAKDYTKIQYKSGGSAFCAACHTQYNVASSVYDAADTKGPVTRVRHKVDTALSIGTTGNTPVTIAANLNAHTRLPVEQAAAFDAAAASGDTVACLTCHQAHGSSATVTPSSSVSPANSSTLLRLNNRGVCQDCHQK